MKSNNLGHRERLRKRFEQSGFSGFGDIEITEYFLMLCIPRKDVKPIARLLFDRFGSFAEIIDQSISDLKEISGIGEATAINIVALREIFGIYFASKGKSNKEQITKMSSLIEMLRAQIGHKQNEVLYAIYLNARNEVLEMKAIGEGTVSQASVFPRKIVEEALKYKATSLILAHNHPGGIAEPSEDDKSITSEIKKALTLVSISLQDHIILASKDYYSFNRSGLL
ncbi:MAG TPA: DNA repair protein RadC [Ignavibacteriales bacterium]|nr:DNA repair protein RadC [Ignavibacteriales bacterium]